MKRDNKGKFIKGFRYHPETEFKKGEHWRKHKPFWDKDWLENEYVKNFRSTKDIADQFHVTEAAICFWLRKHGIKARETSEIRKRKYWGSSGNENGMHGRIGDKNPHWKGGITAERQSFYSSLEWKDCICNVYQKYNRMCAKCGKEKTKENKFAIHHIVGFGCNELRTDINNLVLLCSKCHNFVHSKKNVDSEYLMTYDEFKNKFSRDGELD